MTVAASACDAWLLSFFLSMFAATSCPVWHQEKDLQLKFKESSHLQAVAPSHPSKDKPQLLVRYAFS